MVNCLTEALEHWSDVLLYIGSTRRRQQYQQSPPHLQPLDGQICLDPLVAVRLSLLNMVLQEFVCRLKKTVSAAPDSGFYVYGEVASFIHCLLSLCVSPSALPESSDWESILSVDMSKVAKIRIEDFGQGTDFLHRLVHARSSQSSDFLHQALEFLTEFVSSFQRATSRSVKFFKGLAAFNPTILVLEDTSYGLDCFSCLFGELRRRGWFSAVEKPSALSEYASFATEFAIHHVDSSGVPLSVPNVVDLFVSHHLLSTRPLLSRAFRTACLCLPRQGAPPESLSLGLAVEELSPEAARGLVLPLFSFLSQVGPDFKFPLEKSSVQECQGVLNAGSLLYSDPGFSPWDRVELNCRDDVYPALLAAYKNSCASKSCSQGPSSSSLVGVSGVPTFPDPSVPSAAVRSSLHGKSFRKRSPLKKK